LNLHGGTGTTFGIVVVVVVVVEVVVVVVVVVIPMVNGFTGIGVVNGIITG